jgi:hypothetical protein
MVAFFNRHRVFLLFLVLVVGQILTWRAIVALDQNIQTLGFLMLQKSAVIPLKQAITRVM